MSAPAIRYNQLNTKFQLMKKTKKYLVYNMTSLIKSTSCPNTSFTLAKNIALSTATTSMNEFKNVKTNL
jgi:hypothetical protein